ncbi:MAG: glycosyltransferase family 4 protein [Bryobacterales bacterium]|nr:glycosyltransferase family 4 protein [Bryobacterales bacterium]
MNVALDATPLTEPTGGIRRYTWELAAALAREFPQDGYTLVSDQSYQHPAMDGVRLVNESGPLWWSYRLPRLLGREKIEVFHGTDFSVPYLPVRPTVMTVHDLSPWRGWGVSRVRRRTPWLLRFGLATMVVTPSEAIRRELLDRFPIPPEEVVAIPLAASTRFRPVESRHSGRSYFLYTGMVEPRKNLGVALEAWRALRRDGAEVEFIVTGRVRNLQLAEEPGLRVLGEVPDDDLPALYSNAAAFVYPSLYEGFGLPVLEAMQCGAAVIASCDPALMELSGGACLHAAADDGKGWVEAMRAVLRNGSEYRERAKKRSKLFCWRRTAVQHREVYLHAMRRFHG